ncbi:unnamed protein product [Somion occarium]|uniref:F-box domain-containing protein n=1 Tax=Somion occarium TaxID=3059160 RepID=A0ABP1DWA6_9APHY
MTSINPISNLSQELIDMFIDHLHDDEASLASCSLVCKDWMDASRHHLFRRLTFVDNRADKTFPSLFHFLEQSPHVARHVRQLRLGSAPVRPRVFQEDHERGCSHLETSVFLAILSKVPNLSTLTINNVTLGRRSPTETLDLPTARPQLQRLELVRVVLVAPDVFGVYRYDVLAPFSKVEEFYTDCVFIPDDMSPRDVPLAPDISLQTEVNSVEVHGSFLHLIQPAMALHNLTSLTVAAQYREQLRDFGVVAVGSARTLQRVIIDYRADPVREEGDGDPELQHWASLNLSQCKCLKDLTLRFELLGFPDPIAGPLPWTAAQQILSTTPPNLTSLTFDIIAGVNEGEDLTWAIETMDWNWMRQTLSRFRSLRYIVFTFKDEVQWSPYNWHLYPLGPMAEVGREIIKHELEDWNTRGALKFV